MKAIENTIEFFYLLILQLQSLPSVWLFLPTSSFHQIKYLGSTSKWVNANWTSKSSKTLQFWLFHRVETPIARTLLTFKPRLIQGIILNFPFELNLIQILIYLLHRQGFLICHHSCKVMTKSLYFISKLYLAAAS